VIPILDSRQMRAADDAAIRGGIASLTLMENAAAGISAEVGRSF
jgi:NAD(P)H-hydrate repair Nnr-like enzyme with NAD(P)H-hydrate epimerase domain